MLGDKLRTDGGGWAAPAEAGTGGGLPVPSNCSNRVDVKRVWVPAHVLGGGSLQVMGHRTGLARSLGLAISQSGPGPGTEVAGRGLCPAACPSQPPLQTLMSAPRSRSPAGLASAASTPWGPTRASGTSCSAAVVTTPTRMGPSVWVRMSAHCPGPARGIPMPKAGRALCSKCLGLRMSCSNPPSPCRRERM